MQLDTPATDAEKKDRPAPNFDMVRIMRSKEIVDISPNGIRDLERRGFIKLYHCGKSVFFSKAELEACIRAGVERVKN